VIRKRDKTGSSRKKVKYIFTFDYFETKLLIHVMMMLLCYCFVVVIVAKPHEIKFFFYIKKESQFHPQRNAAQLLSPIVKLKKDEKEELKKNNFAILCSFYFENEKNVRRVSFTQ